MEAATPAPHPQALTHHAEGMAVHDQLCETLWLAQSSNRLTPRNAGQLCPPRSSSTLGLQQTAARAGPSLVE